MDRSSPQDERTAAFYRDRAADLLAPGGHLMSSVPARRLGLDAEHRDAGGRLFTPIGADEIRALFGATGLTLVDVATSSDDFGRPGHEWLEFPLVKGWVTLTR